MLNRASIAGNVVGGLVLFAMVYAVERYLVGRRCEALH